MVPYCQSVMGMEKLILRQIGLLIMIVRIIVIGSEGEWGCVMILTEVFLGTRFWREVLFLDVMFFQKIIFQGYFQMN